jgi:hypothetical protein
MSWTVPHSQTWVCQKWEGVQDCAQFRSPIQVSLDRIFAFEAMESLWFIKLIISVQVCTSHGCTPTTCPEFLQVLRVYFLQQLFLSVAMGRSGMNWDGLPMMSASDNSSQRFTYLHTVVQFLVFFSWHTSAVCNLSWRTLLQATLLRTSAGTSGSGTVTERRDHPVVHLLKFLSV